VPTTAVGRDGAFSTAALNKRRTNVSNRYIRWRCVDPTVVLGRDFPDLVPSGQEAAGRCFCRQAFIGRQRRHLLNFSPTDLNELPSLHQWLNLSVLMTGYPERDGLKAGQSARFRRIEWIVFQSLWQMGSRLLRLPAFADYALEISRPILHWPSYPRWLSFRYTTANEVLVLKGATTKKPNGYGVIREVAGRLVESGEYRGPSFSPGRRVCRAALFAQ